MTIDQRRAILRSRVIDASRDGWQVLYQTDTTADLVRPKRFNWALALISGTFTMGILLVLYVVEYTLAKGESAHLEVTDSGEVIVERSKRGFFRA